MTGRPFSILLLAAAAAVSAALGSAAVADRLGSELGQRLGKTFHQLRVSTAASEEVEEEVSELVLWAEVDSSNTSDATALSDSVPNGAERKQERRRNHRAKAASPRQTHHTIIISAKTVLRLANSGARPSGVSVPKHGVRPAGILLRGVGGLGLGLRDGDVLTHVSGQHVTTQAQVVTLVLGLRGRQIRNIDAIFWRAGKPWRLVVEQPYLEAVAN